MSAHTHGYLVGTCYRCDLNRDEIDASNAAEVVEGMLMVLGGTALRSTIEHAFVALAVAGFEVPTRAALSDALRILRDEETVAETLEGFVLVERP